MEDWEAEPTSDEDEFLEVDEEEPIEDDDTYWGDD